MKLNLLNVPEGGLELSENLAPSDLDIESEIIKFKAPVAIKASVEKGVNTVTVDTRLNCQAELICSRCLTAYNTQIDKKYRFVYEVGHEETTVDISEDIRQELILDFPVKPLCRPDCKGLCPKCGKNLNIEKCSCKS